MVCAKCQRTLTSTTLATPSVKRKSEMYYGSPAGQAKTKNSSSYTNPSASSSSAGVGKSKLLSKAAKNPYAAYSNSCDTCKTKIDQGHKFCQRCAYKLGNACSVCGKAQNNATGGKTGSKGTVVMGQKFSAK